VITNCLWDVDLSGISSMTCDRRVSAIKSNDPSADARKHMRQIDSLENLFRNIIIKHTSAAQVQELSNGDAETIFHSFSSGDDDCYENKKYYVCRGVSYGKMVACDGETCEGEWFHYSCVGLTSPPSGNWYCDDCIKSEEHSSGKGGG
jgi:hypothetical protein